ncbi:TPR-like protein [Venustampulla echinocandica]|uniref:Nonsense-mediated mRNA decay factor n=1 Tax=Venustampulla echinocandica TaxID=2656787 RepID=A0A370U1E1_9HELO|nr:TPR-like protein [Venustampulla echinocandica]RDL41591.1 TPR-like protein [Venustampulla echinocandica]
MSRIPQQPQAQSKSLDQLWVQHQRRLNKTTTSSYACFLCRNRQAFTTSEHLWEHARRDHEDEIPSAEPELGAFRSRLEAESAKKSSPKDGWQPRKQTLNEPEGPRSGLPPPGHSKRPLSSPMPAQAASLADLKELKIRTPGGSEDVTMQDLSEDDDGQATEQPRKRAAVGEGISGGSASPFRDASRSPPLGQEVKERPTSAPGPYSSEPLHGQKGMFEPRPPAKNRQLWTPDTVAPQRSRAPVSQPNRALKSFQSPSKTASSRITAGQHTENGPASSTLLARAPTQGSQVPPTEGERFNIMLQPETRPISQEQLVAEVKGIYAGLVMVEAKCIEVDNKQAALAQADAGNPPKLNNEQWQALIALHRTLLHEHHDFFLASQHPSASPALRRLASKYAMPARMWRHGIHSFLELLRHRLPASLDHMLAFIYLAYSMMALLYETVPAFEDTWIECLGDLGRYRMAIEDEDIRDREVWTGVARHWYSKASDKAPTTGRLYHHLAILARPNALQQLFFYSKSLCVANPFASARDSVLTLFDPVLNAGNGQGPYRLPPFDTAFVKSHGLLFTNRDMHLFDPTVKEFLGLLDMHIGRVTRKFMEQGVHIAIANYVAMLGFAAKDNPVMRAISPSEEEVEVSQIAESPAVISFRNAQRLSNSTSEIILNRVGDPNVLPFIHVILIFMRFMADSPDAMGLLEADFPWESLVRMLNTLLGPYQTRSRIESSEFPIPEQSDDPRPFPEDFAVRGLLWVENYFPAQWFEKKVDEEEKYHERASMTAQRKERILWLACRIANLGPWIVYDGKQFSVSSSSMEGLPSRASTFASATTMGRSDTWETQDTDLSDGEDDMSSPATIREGELSPHD